jgi:hypothetical protein
MLTVKTQGGTVTVDNEFISITRSRMQAWGSDAARGVRRIPIDTITAVQMRPPGITTNGFLQIRMAGGVESRGGTFASLKDENAIQFTRAQKKDVERLRDFLEIRIRQRIQRPAQHCAPQAPLMVTLPPTQADLVTHLRELARLRDEGILTATEFEQQKARALG